MNLSKKSFAYFGTIGGSLTWLILHSLYSICDFGPFAHAQLYHTKILRYHIHQIRILREAPQNPIPMLPTKSLQTSCMNHNESLSSYAYDIPFMRMVYSPWFSLPFLCAS